MRVKHDLKGIDQLKKRRKLQLKTSTLLRKNWPSKSTKKTDLTFRILKRKERCKRTVLAARVILTNALSLSAEC